MLITSDSDDDAFLKLALVVFGLPLDLDFPIGIAR